MSSESEKLLIEQSRFWTGQQVYLKDGRSIDGPYLIAEVKREKVYTLCTLTFEPVDNYEEKNESQLEPA